MSETWEKRLDAIDHALLAIFCMVDRPSSLMHFIMFNPACVWGVVIGNCIEDSIAWYRQIFFVRMELLRLYFGRI
jgi:hypothetical protein